MTRSKKLAKETPRPRIARWFWGSFITILLIGGLLTLFAAIRGGKQWAESMLGGAEGMPKTWTEVIRVTLSGGDVVYIDSDSIPQIRAQTQVWIERQHNEIRRQLQGTLDRKTEAIFQQTSRAVPAFVDWYYSLYGEYARLLYAGFGNLPEYISRQLTELVFEPAGTAKAIEQLAHHLDAEVAEQLHGARRDLELVLTRSVRAHQVTKEPNVEIRLSGQWALDALVVEHLGRCLSLTPEDIARQGIATSAGAVASAATAKKLGAVTVAKASTKLASTKSLGAATAVAVKLGLKSAAKAGGTLSSAGTGAASGAALCASAVVGAPLAPACALVGGALTGLATWLFVDKAMLEADELMHREQLEDELHQALTAQRDALQASLQARYDAMLQTAFSALQQSLEDHVRPTKTTPTKDFVPARAGH
jgi:hypothetical protein